MGVTGTATVLAERAPAVRLAAQAQPNTATDAAGGVMGVAGTGTVLAKRLPGCSPARCTG